MNGKKFDIERDGKEYFVSLSWSDWEGSFSPRVKFTLTVNDELVDEGVITWQHYHWVHSFEKDGHPFTFVIYVPMVDENVPDRFFEIDCYVDGISETDGSDLNTLCERIAKMSWWQKIKKDWRGEYGKYQKRGVWCIAITVFLMSAVRMIDNLLEGVPFQASLFDELWEIFFILLVGTMVLSALSFAKFGRGKKALITRLEEQSKIAKNNLHNEF